VQSSLFAVRYKGDAALRTGSRRKLHREVRLAATWVLIRDAAAGSASCGQCPFVQAQEAALDLAYSGSKALDLGSQILNVDGVGIGRCRRDACRSSRILFDTIKPRFEHIEPLLDLIDTTRKERICLGRNGSLAKHPEDRKIRDARQPRDSQKTHYPRLIISHINLSRRMMVCRSPVVIHPFILEPICL
jgi:hypothetical protein